MVRERVRDAYLPALIIQENLTILDKNITNVAALLKETKATYEAGFVEQLDVDRLELSLANLNTDRESLERQLKLAYDGLKFAIGYPIQDELAVSDNLNTLLKEASAEELQGNINYYSRPEYKQAELGVKLQELNIKYNKMGYLPSLSAEAAYQYGYQGNELFNDPNGFWVPTSFATLRLNVPIFDGFYTKALVQRARIEEEKARNQKQELERTITFEVENARKNYLNAYSRLKSQRKNLALAERIYRTTQIKYKEGVGSSIELSQAEQSLYQSQQNEIQAKYDLLTAKTALDKALGEND